MTPIGEHIKIELHPEQAQAIITEKAPLAMATVVAVSPDITVPFTSGSQVHLIKDKVVALKGSLFIHCEHILLYS